jgi:hypothetical protein
VIEVSTSMAKHSRFQSSTMVRQRTRRPSARPSETKSIDQLTLAATEKLNPGNLQARGEGQVSRFPDRRRIRRAARAQLAYTARDMGAAE